MRWLLVGGLRGGGGWRVAVDVVGELEVVGGGGYREACFYTRGRGCVARVWTAFNVECHVAVCYLYV